MALGVAVALAAAAPAAAQTPATPPAVFRYTPSQLDCAAFRERSRGRLEAQTGSRQRHETLARDGVWRMRARAAPAGVALEAWYDSLALKRESPEGTRAPDTDGLLGGRYRGTLTPAGAYRPEASPFIPDEVAEVAELGGALADLLPRVPPVALAVGEQWADSAGLELRRLTDSLAGRRVVQRLELRWRSEANHATVRGDTTTIAARQVTVEDGRVDWDPKAGVLRRVRHIVVETSVPTGGLVRQPLRSRLEQEVSLVRIRGACEADSRSESP